MRTVAFREFMTLLDRAYTASLGLFVAIIVFGLISSNVFGNAAPACVPVCLYLIAVWRWRIRTQFWRWWYIAFVDKKPYLEQGPRSDREYAYTILGVDPTDDLPSIRKAYRTMAQSHHPDRAPPGGRAEANARYMKVVRAYDLIATAEIRRQYDDWIEKLGYVPPLDGVYEWLKDEIHSSAPEPDDSEPEPSAQASLAAPARPIYECRACGHVNPPKPATGGPALCEVCGEAL
jgi:hypothetical protein